MYFSELLIDWYLKTNRNLPWRKNQDPYPVWLSEIILLQTKVSQGLPYFLKFIKIFPTVFDLAKADTESVLKLWQGLGYYSRARNLHSTAKYIANDLNGIFPDNYSELLSLKGVGDYTASAIASICYSEPVAVVDGNVYRVLSRYFGIKTPINSSKGKKEFKELAEQLLDETRAGTYNQAIMDFGALHCKPKIPLCDTCMFTSRCLAFLENKVLEYPVKERKIKVKNRYFNYVVVLTSDNKTILENRKGKGIWQGLYQFPLIESEKSISVEQLIQSNELKKISDNILDILLFNQKDFIHKLSHQHLHTKFWIVTINKSSHEAVSWSDVDKYPVPTLIDNFLKQFLSKKLNFVSLIETT